MIDIKKQIESIIEDLVNNASISSILLKAQAIAFYLKDEAFTNWIKSEQNGYSDIKELPEYRKARCTIKVDVTIPFRGMLTNMDFPIDAIENKTVRDDLAHMCFVDSIFTIEQMGNNTNSDTLKMNASAYTFRYINKHYPEGNIEGVRKITNTSAAKAIVDKVKSKLLDFFLKIEEQIDLNVNFDVMANKEKIQTIVNQTIKAGVVNTGDGSISINNSEIIGGNDTVTINTAIKKELTDIINKIEDINKKYNNADLAQEIIEVKDDLTKSKQHPKLIKRAFNAMKGISMGIVANELTPIIDRGLELITNLF